MDVRAFGVLDPVCGLVVIIWVPEFVTKFGVSSVCVCFGGFELCGCRRVRDSKLKRFFSSFQGKRRFAFDNSEFFFQLFFCDYKFGFCCAFGTLQPRSQSIQLGY